MKASLLICPFLVIALFWLACAAADEEVISVPEIAAHRARTEETVPGGIAEPRMIGCWSSGTGELLRILPNQLIYGFVRKSIDDSPKPVKFDILQEGNNRVSLIRLIDRPQFFIFRNYVKFEVRGEGEIGSELSEQSFETFDEYLEGKISGYSGGWVHDNCKTWYPKWYENHYGIK